ncbi:hypothetical protein DPEC_G00216130 [Dallia pectoralis]|uniref:Uncharacterized protein n=1 Tax=Dallia pectoralis TaxID=75939 RepID=A0ACC2G244_DALPE|nr:hypothetical protein DPEC_G00216130 [Dallia pectoralis]
MLRDSPVDEWWRGEMGGVVSGLDIAHPPSSSSIISYLGMFRQSAHPPSDCTADAVMRGSIHRDNRQSFCIPAGYWNRGVPLCSAPEKQRLMGTSERKHLWDDTCQIFRIPP